MQCWAPGAPTSGATASPARPAAQSAAHSPPLVSTRVSLLRPVITTEPAMLPALSGTRQARSPAQQAARYQQSGAHKEGKGALRCLGAKPSMRRAMRERGRRSARSAHPSQTTRQSRGRPAARQLGASWVTLRAHCAGRRVLALHRSKCVTDSAHTFAAGRQEKCPGQGSTRRVPVTG